MGDTLTFEDAMKRLQEIVNQLETGESPLEESIQLFEEGAKLSARCYSLLDKAEQRVTQLSQLPEQEEEDHAEDL